jgi:hypothetical protein
MTLTQAYSRLRVRSVNISASMPGPWGKGSLSCIDNAGEKPERQALRRQEHRLPGENNVSRGSWMRE